MFYNNLFCFLVAIFVFSASNPPEKPWLPPVVALALLLASLWLFAAVAGRQFAAAASAGRYFRAERRLSFLAVGLFVVLVGLLDLKYYLQPLSLGDRLPVLTDIGGLAVFFLLLALVWPQGRRRYMQLFHSRYSAVGFLWSNLKANLPAVLPWLILSLVFDLLQLVPYQPLARFLRSAYGELALFGLFVVFLVLFFPPLVRVLWNCRPLPPGPLREHIVSFCRAQGFRSEVLCWPLFEGQVLTAGIIGILPGLRYLLITPALVDNLDREELDSVLAHEIGHVVSRHIAQRLDKGSKVGAVSILAGLAGLALGVPSLSQGLLVGSMAAGQAINLQYSREDEEQADRLSFGWMQRMERDPASMQEMLRTMRRITRYRMGGEVPQYLLTHPNPEARMGYVESLVELDAKRPDHKPYPKADDFAFLRFKYRVLLQSMDQDRLRIHCANTLASAQEGSQQAVMAHYGLAL